MIYPGSLSSAWKLLQSPLQPREILHYEELEFLKLQVNASQDSLLASLQRIPHPCLVTLLISNLTSTLAFFTHKTSKYFEILQSLPNAWWNASSRLPMNNAWFHKIKASNVVEYLPLALITTNMKTNITILWISFKSYEKINMRDSRFLIKE